MTWVRDAALRGDDRRTADPTRQSLPEAACDWLERARDDRLHCLPT
ncbi:hypothetical protein [Sphingomonas zeae]